jgi:capsular exopolysaccharide synthesis family protein
MSQKLQWNDNELLVALNDRSGMAGEQYRRMRIRIETLRETLGGTLKLILVTSPMMGEGKTATAANLALDLAGEEGRKVLLVDVDMRKPRIHSFFRSVPGAGLGDVLVGGVPLKEAIASVENSNLDVLVLPRGSDRRIDPLPMERLKSVFTELRSRYDLIVCDAPPVLPIADTAALARLADGILIVVRAGVTPRQAVARTLTIIDRNKLIGFVLNAVPERTLDRYYYSYRFEDAEGEGEKDGRTQAK